MPRCNGRAHTLALGSGNFQEADLPSPEIVQFWESLPVSRRGKLLSVERKTIFAKIRELYCSRCFGRDSQRIKILLLQWRFSERCELLPSDVLERDEQ